MEHVEIKLKTPGVIAISKAFALAETALTFLALSADFAVEPFLNQIADLAGGVTTILQWRFCNQQGGSAAHGERTQSRVPFIKWRIVALRHFHHHIDSETAVRCNAKRGVEGRNRDREAGPKAEQLGVFNGVVSQHTAILILFFAGKSIRIAENQPLNRGKESLWYLRPA